MAEQRDQAIRHAFIGKSLGSGVKVNTPATLTNRVTIHMLENELPLGEVVRALSETLPVRGILRSGAQKAALQFQTDGALALVRELLNVDHVHFTVGKTVNPAHQNPNLPHQLGIRMGVVRELADELRGRNCEVTIEEV